MIVCYGQFSPPQTLSIKLNHYFVPTLYFIVFLKTYLADVIKDIYDVCTFEYAWYHDKKTTPWCAAFTKDQLRVSSKPILYNTYTSMPINFAKESLNPFLQLSKVWFSGEIAMHS